MADSSYWHSRTGRRVSRRWALGTTALGAGAAFLAACGGSDDKPAGDQGGVPASGSSVAGAPAAPAAQATTSGEAPVRGGTMRKGTYLNVLGIDPHIEVSIGFIMMTSVYTYLGAMNPVEQKFYPIVAESVEQVSPSEFVFKLRKGVKFHDVQPVNGRELTAEDVKYSKERFRDLPQAQNNDYYKKVVDKMDVVDPYTFRVTTKQPWAESLIELGGVQQAIVPREAVEKFKDLSQNAIGAGPYILEEYVKGERTLLKRNPNYFEQGKPYPDAIKWQTILDQATLREAYRTDQIDIGQGAYEGTLLNKLDYEDLLKNKNLVNTKMLSLSYGSLGVNASVKPFDDKRVRQALWVGVDRQQFVDKHGLGEGVPQGVLAMSLNYWALSPDELKPYIGPDVKKAKDLLAAAGYANGFEMEIETSGGVQQYIDHAEILVAELKKLNITAKLKLSDLSSFLSDKLFKGNFTTCVFTHNPYETPKVPLGFYHKDGLGNGSWFHYSNPEVTAIIDAQNAETDVTKRQKLVKDAQKLILEDGGPLINFYTRPLFQSHHKRVGGINPAERVFHYFRYSEYLKPN
jgi:peptide/nickel transport system substrate-binding protein